MDRVISYASRTLTDAEKNYNLHSGKLEFLALKWAITERFADYLRYSPRKFDVFTDNNPLTYVLTSAKLNATGLRWVADLAEFDFTINYRPGKENVDADCLSRKPLELSELKKKCTESVEPSSVAAVLVSSSEFSCQSVASVCNIDVSVCELSVPDGEMLHVSKQELVGEQKLDLVVGPVRECVLLGKKPDRAGWDRLTPESKILMKSFSKLSVVDGVLLRKTEKHQQVVLPKRFHKLVYVELHEKMAHIGAEKVLDLAHQRFYWPRMNTDIEHYIRRECRCIVTKKPNIPDRAPLVPIHATYPFQMVSVDFLHLDKCQGGFEYVLVVVDHFTRFCQLYATRSKSSQAAAAKMWTEFIPRFGLPEKIHHDQGGEFNSKLWSELHRYSGIRASNTTPYHPEGNGMTERLNRTVLNMLKALPEDEKKKWKYHLPQLAFAYNSTTSKSTGYSPFYLMFGRNSRLPVDEMFGLNESPAVKIEHQSHSQFVEEWKNSMKQAFKLANEHIEKAGGYNKQHYDRKIHGVELKVGDQVLLRNMREKGGTGKLRSHFERGVFEVVEKRNKLPVYVIKNVNKEKDRRTVHRSKLMECNDLPKTVFEEVSVKKNNTKGRINREKEVLVETDDEDTTDVAVFLHEDVPDSFLGGGDGVEGSHEAVDEAIADSPEEANTEADVATPDIDDETIPYQDDDRSPRPTRHSSRQVTHRKLFSYDEIGGPPVLVDIIK